MTIFFSMACLNQRASTFCSVTQSLLGAHQATMPHMKEDAQSFNMNPNDQIFVGEKAMKTVL